MPIYVMGNASSDLENLRNPLGVVLREQNLDLVAIELVPIVFQRK